MNLIKLIEEHGIIRRYIIINSFDGALTILGILIASFVFGMTEKKAIILPCIGAIVAMFFSGFFGAYEAEMAEIKKAVKEMERHLLKKLAGTKVEKEKKEAAFFVALANGISPSITALLVLLPFFFLSTRIAYYFSFALVAIALFLLGIFAGKTAKENVLKHGFRMLIAGLAVAVAIFGLVLLRLI